MNDSFEIYIREVSADGDTLVQAMRFYISEITDDLSVDEMRADLAGVVKSDALEDALRQLESNPKVLEAAAHSYLAWAWHESRDAERVRRVVLDAKRMLPIIETIVLAIVAMYGMYLYTTKGRKTETRRTTLPDGSVSELTIAYYNIPVLSPLVDLIKVSSVGVPPMADGESGDGA